MSHQKLSCIIIVFSLMFIGSGTAWAADDDYGPMAGRLGIGANLALSGGMGLSGRYWISDNIGVEGIFNFTSADSDAGDTSYFALAGRGMYTLFDYGAVNACVGSGIAFGSTETSDDFGNSNDENFFGIEFFFLVETMLNRHFSISGQTGLSYIDANDTSVLSVGTPSFLGLFGFHFYL